MPMAFWPKSASSAQDPVSEVVAASLVAPRCLAVNPVSGSTYIIEDDEYHNSGSIVVLQSSYHHTKNPMAREQIQSVKLVKMSEDGDPLPAEFDSSITIRPQTVCVSPDGKTLYFSQRYEGRAAVYRMDLETRRCEQLLDASKTVNGLCLDSTSGMLFVADTGADQIKRFAFQTNGKLVHEVESALPAMPFELIDLICDLTHLNGVDFSLDVKCPVGIAHANGSNLIAFVQLINSTITVWNYQTNRLIRQWKFDLQYRQKFAALSTLEWSPMCMAVAFDAEDQSLFVTDSMNSCLLRCYIATGEIIIAHSFAVGSERVYSKPRPVGILHCPEKHSLYVCDVANGIVSKLNTTKLNESRKTAALIKLDYDALNQPLDSKTDGNVPQQVAAQEGDYSNDTNAPEGISPGKLIKPIPRPRKGGFVARLARVFTCH